MLNLPAVGWLFGRKDVQREETELIVLVSPQLVHPLEGDDVPPLLPGMEVTDPTDHDFFLRQTIEGFAGFDHRSTVHAEIDAQNIAVDRWVRRRPMRCHSPSPRADQCLIPLRPARMR